MSKVSTRYNRKQLYGVTQEQYEALLSLQKGRCMICRELPKKKELSVDHDHKTGRIRALLCDQCNFGLGHFKDNKDLLRYAIAYLELYGQD